MRINNPKQIALYSAVIIALTVGIIVALLSLNINSVFILIAASILISFGAAYYAVYYFTERFLYGKIKLIYKNISNLKTSKATELKINMSEDVLGTVSSEVESWTDHKTKEIKDLQDQEAFRREFIGNLAHELKTPIFSIQGYILTLLEGGLEDSSVNRDFLLRAAKGVDRMTHIVEDLDEITKFESGQIPIEKTIGDIVELTKDIMDSFEHKAKKRNVKLQFKESYDRQILVKMDGAKIGQVLTNLINNAVIYSKEEGGEVEIRFYPMDKNLLIEVADNGKGIAESHLPRLFERFYRIDKSRSRDVGGTGLGLAIVKHIVEGHGQSIDVRSTEGVGSTFSFTLELV